LTRLLAIAAAIAAVTTAAAFAATPTTGTYTGSTGQRKAAHHAVSLRVNGKRNVVHFRIDWRATRCDSGDHHWESRDTNINGIENEPDGVFHHEGTHNLDAGGGITGRTKITLHGHFADATHAKGKWHAKVRVLQDGEQVDTCRTTTRWHVGP
jgi:hypothetical protein